MLVLSRKTEETIQLPDLGIEIQILKIRGGSVSIGINAPRQVRILRGELLDASPATTHLQSRIRQTVH